MNWPLPNISHMIERIGALKPKKFAKFDMTKGYWQLGLAPAVRQATAFITWIITPFKKSTKYLDLTNTTVCVKVYFSCCCCTEKLV